MSGKLKYLHTVVIITSNNYNCYLLGPEFLFPVKDVLSVNSEVADYVWLISFSKTFMLVLVTFCGM